MKRSIQIVAMILLLLSVNYVNAQTMLGVYKSEDVHEVFSTLNGNILTVIDDGAPGLFIFSGYNASYAFYTDQFLGIVSLTLDAKKIVINSIPKRTSVTYTLVRVESINNSLNNSSINSSNFSQPNQTQRKCVFCNGTGECYLCNSAGQSKACVQNQFGVTCSDSYCIAKNHRCKDCGGTHVCQNCKGKGYK